MKVLYIHQYFRTPSEGGAIRSYHLAKALVKAGHEVVLITGHSSRLHRRENIEGIEVHYLPVYYSNWMGFTSRIYAFLKFLILAYKKAASLKGVNICYATSTPLTVGIVALFLKKFRKLPYIFEVRDLWPEVPIEMGYIKNPFLVKFLYLLEKAIYKNSDKIVALSPGILEGIKRSLGNVKKEILLIPNFSDLSFYKPEEETTNAITPFTIAYAGAFGKANLISSLYEVIKLSSEKFGDKVFFELAGKGAEKGNLLVKLQKNLVIKYFLKLPEKELRRKAFW